MHTDETLPVRYLGMSLTDEIQMYPFINVQNGRFMSGNFDLGNMIEGHFILIGKRFLRWSGNGLVLESVPCDDERDCLYGWVIAYDLQVAIDGNHYILTVLGKDLELALLPYMHWLLDSCCHLDEVRTLVKARDMGVFTTLEFYRLDLPGIETV